MTAASMATASRRACALHRARIEDLGQGRRGPQRQDRV